MTEAELDEMLTWAREQLYTPDPDHNALPAACFTFGRARELTLNDRRWTAAERAHAANCRRCTHFLSLFAAEMPHLPVGWLVRKLFSRSSRTEAQSIDYHLVEGGCTRCAARLAALERRRRSAALFPDPISLLRPAAATASTALHLEEASEDGRLQVELYQEEGQTTLEVRSKDAGLNYQLVGYWLAGTEGGGDVSGYVVLHPDVDGWYTGHVRFEPVTLYSTLGGECRAAVLQPVERSVLTHQERGQLLESALRGREDQEALRAWRDWAARDEPSLPDETRQILAEIRETLQ